MLKNIFTYFASLFVSAMPGSPWRRGFIKGQIRAAAGQAEGKYKAVETSQTILADT